MWVTVLFIPFIQWVRRWQGVDLLFNIWGGYFGIFVMCLLKYGVLNEMFSFVLIGTYKGNVQHFTLTQRFPSPQHGTRTREWLPCVFGKRQTHFTQSEVRLEQCCRAPRPWAQQQGSSPISGSHYHARTQNCRQQQRAQRRKWILLACFMVLRVLP